MAVLWSAAALCYPRVVVGVVRQRPVSELLEWFKDPENRAAAQALAAVAAVVVAWATGLLRWVAGLIRGRPGPARPEAGKAPPQMVARSGGVNVAGNARDVRTGAGAGDDPS